METTLEKEAGKYLKPYQGLKLGNGKIVDLDFGPENT